MHITIAEKPNALGSYRYDVRANGRSTHGYRPNPAEARKAATEDGNLMYMAGREPEDDLPDATVPKRLRRKED